MPETRKVYMYHNTQTEEGHHRRLHRTWWSKQPTKWTDGKYLMHEEPIELNTDDYCSPEFP